MAKSGTPLLPALLVGGVGAALLGVIAMTIVCGVEGCIGADASPEEPASIETILPPHCITMPDGARLCDAPSAVGTSETGQ